jgi:hypothetical protein
MQNQEKRNKIRPLILQGFLRCIIPAQKIFRRCPGRVPTAGDGRDRAADWSLRVLTLKPGMHSGKGSGHRDGAAALLAIAPKNRSILSMKEGPGRQQKRSGLWD